MAGRYFIGVDVGTGSARAGVFDADGALKAAAKRPVQTWTEAGDFVEQSGEQIWQAVGDSVREAVAAAGLRPDQIAGIGFDATCSLAVVDPAGDPVTVSRSGDPARNVIVWMDHRATGEAEEINAGGHPVLKYVGGTISPEMETPKLLWLKRNLPASFAAAGHFFDLADYLTWRATGSLARSVCTVTCKWTYVAFERRWDASYFRSIGLGALADEDFARIGTEILDPGTALGEGLTSQAAVHLGLMAGTPVAASLIDAHAGGLGTLGCTVANAGADPHTRLAYIFGTSACSMASTDEPVEVAGVWGPYYSAMIPGLWLLEGGQSAAGAAVDHLVHMHPYAPEAERRATAEGLSLVDWLARAAAAKAPTSERLLDLAGGRHVVPEFLGNRSPLADPDARAILAGIGLDVDLDSLLGLYVAGLFGLGYGLRQLLDRLRAKGVAIEQVIASGGAARSPFVRQVLADAAGTPVAASEASEPVLLGAAMLASVAAGDHASIGAAMSAMSGRASVLHPEGGAVAARHVERMAAFEALQTVARSIRGKS
jgi:D-ribulokinase